MSPLVYKKNFHEKKIVKMNSTLAHITGGWTKTVKYREKVHKRPNGN